MPWSVSVLARKNANMLEIVQRKKIKGSKRALERELKKIASSFSFGSLDGEEITIWW